MTGAGWGREREKKRKEKNNQKEEEGRRRRRKERRRGNVLVLLLMLLFFNQLVYSTNSFLGPELIGQPDAWNVTQVHTKLTAGSKALEPLFAAFPSTAAGNWIRSRAAESPPAGWICDASATSGA